MPDFEIGTPVTISDKCKLTYLNGLDGIVVDEPERGRIPVCLIKDAGHEGWGDSAIWFEPEELEL